MDDSVRDTVAGLLDECDIQTSPAVAEKLLGLVYDELRALAGRYLRKERCGHTLQPTALVHEAYLRLVDQTKVQWRGKAHFYAVCAQAMHRILIDHARGRRRVKRGRGWRQITLDPDIAPWDAPEVDLEAVHRAIEQLALLDARQAQIVELRFFAGLTVQEVAHVLGVSQRTVQGDWMHAKAWLRATIDQNAG